jgi:hypothetical protein
MRQLTVLIDRCTRLSRIELTMLERAGDRILRPVEDTGICVVDAAEEQFWTAEAKLKQRGRLPRRPSYCSVE